MVFFFAELGLMDYSTTIRYCPSKLAASAVYAARCTLNKAPLWTETLKHHTGYSEDQIMCVSSMISPPLANLELLYIQFSVLMSF